MPTLVLSEKSSASAIHHTETTGLPKYPEDVYNVPMLNDDDLPPGYFTSRFFIGSIAAICANLGAGVGGFSLIAPILPSINNDIGASKSIIWVALVFTICLAVSLALLGRLSDLFGRRWFFISGNILGVVGCTVCATANTVPVLIGGEVLVGLASATGSGFAFVTGELVPMKYRFAANSFVCLFQIPTACLGPALSQIFVTSTAAGWRWCYYYLIIWNVVALILFALFYHPPTFHMKHANHNRMEWIKNYDFLGTAMFIAGVVLFVMGLSWGGSSYPWKSGQVICTIVVGGTLLIIFGLYEAYVPLTGSFIPSHLFKRRRWVATTVVISLCGGVYYPFAIVWPSMVTSLYSKPNDPLYAGYLACVVGCGITAGQVIGGFLARPIGKTGTQTMVTFTCGVIFLASMATCTPASRDRAIALLSIGTAFIGYADSVAITTTTIDIDDQNDIGIASGVVGAVRSVVGAVCSAIYSTVAANRLTQTLAAQVPPALINAGLPESSVPSFMWALALGTPDAFRSVEGISANILSAGIEASKQASMDAYRTVFLVSLAFGGVGIICSCFVPNIDDRMTGQVSARLKWETESEGVKREVRI